MPNTRATGATRQITIFFVQMDDTNSEVIRLQLFDEKLNFHFPPRIEPQSFETGFAHLHTTSAATFCMCGVPCTLSATQLCKLNCALQRGLLRRRVHTDKANFEKAGPAHLHRASHLQWQAACRPEECFTSRKKADSPAGLALRSFCEGPETPARLELRSCVSPRSAGFLARLSGMSSRPGLINNDLGNF